MSSKVSGSSPESVLLTIVTRLRDNFQLGESPAHGIGIGCQVNARMSCAIRSTLAALNDLPSTPTQETRNGVRQFLFQTNVENTERLLSFETNQTSQRCALLTPR